MTNQLGAVSFDCQKEQNRRFRCAPAARLACVLSLLCVFLLEGCSRPTPALRIRVGVFDSVDNLPYFVLRARGFDRAAGLQMEEKQYTGGAAILEDMQKNLVDLGVSIGTVPVLNAASHGLVPSLFVPVASECVSNLRHPAVGLVVSSSLSSFSDLQGKFFATNARNSVGGLLLSARLKHEGVSNFTIIEMAFANQGLAVAGGNVAGAALVEPYLTQSLARGDGRLLDWLTGKPPFEAMPYTMIVFRAGFLRESPEAARRYLRAHLRAVQWIENHEKEARSILGTRAGIHEDVVQKMSLPEWPLDGRNDPRLLLALETEMKSQGMLPSILPPEMLYDETLLDIVRGRR